jgi:tetratricopeptide (TPR) repeat protein
MSEELENLEVGSSEADPAAVAFALAGADRAEANAYLKDQRRLVQLQAKELAHELKLRHWSMWVRHCSALLKLTLEGSVAIVLVGLVACIAGAVWNAAHDDGLVIEAFSVPPGLAAQGLTGQVVAARIQDNLSALQAATNSSRAPSSFANNWGDDIKVEIPDTGLSVGEVSRYLHRVLGHQTYISGEVVDRDGKITITARTNANPAARASGADSDVDAVLDQVAESIFARTQPYRYGVYLLSHGRSAEVLTFFRNAAHTGPVDERAWAWAGLFNYYLTHGQMAEAEEAAKASIAQRRDFAWGWSKVAFEENSLGRPERALSAWVTTLNLLGNGGATDLRPEGIVYVKDMENSGIDHLHGDYGGELVLLRKNYPGFTASRLDVMEMVQTFFAKPGANPFTVAEAFESYGALLALQHDMVPARHVLDVGQAVGAAIAQHGESVQKRDASDTPAYVAQTFRLVAMQIALTGQDWRQLLDLGHAYVAAEPDLAARSHASGNPPTAIWPLLALADAETGDFKTAHAQIDRTPADCDLCLRMRGRIDALQKNASGADYWFAKAEALAPFLVADQQQNRRAQGAQFLFAEHDGAGESGPRRLRHGDRHQLTPAGGREPGAARQDCRVRRTSAAK